ncbi:phosphoglycerate mutase-like protein [Suillus fuscotomentosus]|uniref:Phosphoglycerate mutase-like protein n=1 Tax=Suillus fuscotomentosus TaxID=1912939 RepID=A0AAD4EE89_9AGAM|nr:phosphoglycerate mutase-like protein [Suillus fuscotomentosus]KAG1904522.1 phosphoglycerate mutase-like protein [Suillus fuscotomentosus]
MVNTTTAAGLIGVVLLARHGDRTAYYQDPATYNSTQAYITPLGEQQEFELGSFLRNIYLNPDSPSFIQNISTDVADINQLAVRADAGGGNVILNSAYALLQGLYPSTQESEITLANGTTVLSPLGGYQYVPVQSLEYWQSPSLTSWMDCEYFQSHLNRTYASSAWLNMSATAAPFLTALKPYLGSVSNNFTNMWNIYDHVNVQYTYNKTYYETLPPSFLQQARYYANWAQNSVFTDSTSASIGQVAIRTLLPEIFWALGNMTKTSNKVKMNIQEVDYKPFISLFNVTNATLTDPDISGIANYASVVALELSQDSQGQYEVSMKFKNGTEDSQFRQLEMFGNTSITFDKFVQVLDSTTINSTNNWCFSCNQTVLRGCSVYNYSSDPFLGGVGTGY